MSQIMEIKVYDKNGKVKKTCTAEMLDLRFGTIRSIIEILNVENIEDTEQLLLTVTRAWEQVTGILSECFPDMSYEDWENVKMKELMPVLIGILKYSFREILTIPKNPKN